MIHVNVTEGHNGETTEGFIEEIAGVAGTKLKLFYHWKGRVGSGISYRWVDKVGNTFVSNLGESDMTIEVRDDA